MAHYFKTKKKSFIQYIEEREDGYFLYKDFHVSKLHANSVLSFWELPVSKRDIFTSAEHLDLTASSIKTPEQTVTTSSKPFYSIPLQMGRKSGILSGNKNNKTPWIMQTRWNISGETGWGCSPEVKVRREAVHLKRYHDDMQEVYRTTEAFTVKHCHTVRGVPDPVWSSQHNCMQSYWRRCRKKLSDCAWDGPTTRDGTAWQPDAPEGCKVNVVKLECCFRVWSNFMETENLICLKTGQKLEKKCFRHFNQICSDLLFFFF